MATSEGALEGHPKPATKRKPRAKAGPPKPKRAKGKKKGGADSSEGEDMPLDLPEDEE
jgi:hypothetical protein